MQSNDSSGNNYTATFRVKLGPNVTNWRDFFFILNFIIHFKAFQSQFSGLVADCLT